jgi:hypothetical protein
VAGVAFEMVAALGDFVAFLGAVLVEAVFLGFAFLAAAAAWAVGRATARLAGGRILGTFFFVLADLIRLLAQENTSLDARVAEILSIHPFGAIANWATRREFVEFVSSCRTPERPSPGKREAKCTADLDGNPGEIEDPSLHQNVASGEDAQASPPRNNEQDQLPRSTV